MITTAMALTALAVSSAVGAGMSVYSSNQQSKAMKNAASDQAAKDAAAVAEAKNAKATSAAQASARAKSYQSSISRSNTVMTSPLGVAAQANTARKSLLGQ
jgi:uncharacterized protein HemX